MMVFLTAVIAFTGVVGIWLVIQGGKDTGRIRDAAEKQAGAAQKIAYASKRNADAAHRFADTAALINGGIGDAVKKLDAQARATQQTAGTAGEALEAQTRPWLGIVDVPTVDPIPEGSRSLHRISEVKLQDLVHLRRST